MAFPSDSEEIHILPREKSPRLLATALSPRQFPPPLPSIASPPASSMGHWPALKIFVVLSVAMALVGLGIIGLRYQFQKRAASSKEIATGKSAPILPVTPDLLRVSAIALGDVRLAIVNSKRLEEGDALAVETPAGVISLRVVKIADGVVHFEHKGQTLTAKLPVESAQKSRR